MSDGTTRRRESVVTHSFRRNSFTPERTYRLESDALTWTEGAKSGRVAYRDIDRARIYSMPPYAGHTVRRTTLRGRFPGKLGIRAMHSVGLGDTEDRAESYFQFVEELLARIKAANPDLTIRVGQPWALYLFWLFLLACYFVLIPMMLLLLFGPGWLEGAVGLVILGTFLPIVWRMVRRGRPHVADASALYNTDMGRQADR